METRQKLCITNLSFLLVPTAFFVLMLRGSIGNLLIILHGIIQHISNRHRIMDLCLILYPQKHIGRFPIFHNDCLFHKVTVFLYCLRFGCVVIFIIFSIFCIFIIFSIFLIQKYRYLSGIQLSQLIRLNLLLTIIHKVVECICEYFVFSYVSLCNCICCSYVVHSPYSVQRHPDGKCLRHLHSSIKYC